MASLKNVDKTKQRIHKERPQLSHRKNLGELERKKDYKLRASQHQKKQKTLKVLSKKTLERNPDEFYFHMINSKTEDGVHIEKESTENEETTADQEKLMRSQDIRYVTLKLSQERKKIEKLLAELHLNDPRLVINKRIKFAEEGESSSQRKLPRVKSHPSLKKREDLSFLLDPEIYKNVDHERKLMYKELAKRIEREKELDIVRRKLLIKQQVTESRRKGIKPKKVKKGGSKRVPIYVWPQERKK